jgi:hypothetical protein
MSACMLLESPNCFDLHNSSWLFVQLFITKYDLPFIGIDVRL